MTRDLRYLLLDVFTDTAFRGNQLAVFPEAGDLPAPLMQTIARELNLSETVFVLPVQHAEATHRLRIFTPSLELPFAGHPTIGCAVALMHLRAGSGGPGVLVFEEGAGLVRVEVEGGGSRPFTATLTSPKRPVRIDLPLDTSRLAAIVGLRPEALGPAAPHAYSAGVPFTFVPVVSEEALTAARINQAAWQETLAATAAPHIYLFTMTDWARGRDIRARMFAPAMGIAEDPATGGAAAALAGFLGDLHDLSDGVAEWRILQGVSMGRPSEIFLSAASRGGKLEWVKVGGAAIVIGHGWLRGEWGG
jgi:trans-2,3-dihydro-3-hydroxyanthranilate isomerase